MQIVGVWKAAWKAWSIFVQGRPFYILVGKGVHCGGKIIQWVANQEEVVAVLVKVCDVKERGRERGVWLFVRRRSTSGQGACPGS